MAGMGVHRAVLNVHCSRCGKRCSGVDPELGLVVRAWVECPECIEKSEGKSAKSEGNSSARQLLDLERDLRESLRGGYLFGNFDEPLDAAGVRIVRVIQQRLSDMLCECTDRTPGAGGYRCQACGSELRTGRRR